MTGQPVLLLLLPLLYCRSTTGYPRDPYTTGYNVGPYRDDRGAYRDDRGAYSNMAPADLDKLITNIIRARQQQIPLAEPDHAIRDFAYLPTDREYYAPPRPAEGLQKHPQSSAEHEESTTPEPEVTQSVSRGPALVETDSGGRHGAGEPEVAPDDDEGESSDEDAMSSDKRVVHIQPQALQTLHQPTVTGNKMSDIYFIITVSGLCVLVVGFTVGGGFFYHRVKRRARDAADAEYPAYGITGPNKDLSPSGDRKLAQSAQMYHYQHQKQQMMAMEKNHTGRHGSASDVDSDEENEEGDYTVYECPGLAPSGEMEVKNPLFQDDPTPAQITDK